MSTMRMLRHANRLAQAYGRVSRRSFHHSVILLQEEKKRLDVAIVGLPNAGKSQLLNKLTESTVAAVSRKRHTTRDEILGARTVDDTQLVFLDTPGFVRYDQAKREGLNRDITSTATAEMENVDFSLLVVDAARRLTDDYYRESLAELMLAALKSRGRLEISKPQDNTSDSQEPSTVVHAERRDNTPRPKFAVVLNKVDLVHPKLGLIDIAESIGLLAEECANYRGQTSPDEETVEMDEDYLDAILPTFFYTSALKDQGVDDVLNFLLDRATPCESWEMEAGETTLLTPEERVEEVIREKIYRCLHKEVPYQIRQTNRLFQFIPNKSGTPGLLVHQDLVVRSKSHQELVFGGGGKTLERIRETAQRDLKIMFKCDVVLQLHVKLLKRTQRNWSI